MSDRHHLPLAPDLELYLIWSPHMSDALHRRYEQVIFRRPEASAHDQQQYDSWCFSKERAYVQIQRLYMRTGSLPVAGDYLLHGVDTRGGETLRVEKRTLFTTSESNALIIVYELCGEEEELAGWVTYPDEDLVGEPT